MVILYTQSPELLLKNILALLINNNFFKTIKEKENGKEEKDLFFVNQKRINK